MLTSSEVSMSKARAIPVSVLMFGVRPSRTL
nr:MAG TPA_asm: hypothetical protein [Caudoviricetes sp.]